MMFEVKKRGRQDYYREKVNPNRNLDVSLNIILDLEGIDRGAGGGPIRMCSHARAAHDPSVEGACRAEHAAQGQCLLKLDY